MDNQRLFLFVALSIVIMLLYSAWQEQYGPQPQAVPVEAQTPATPGTPTSPVDQPGATPTQPAAAATAQTPPVVGQTMASQQQIRVQTDILDVVIDSVGGDIRRAALLKYPEHADTPDKPVQLFDDRLPRLLIAQSGLLSNSGKSFDHHVAFSVADTQYTLDEGNDSLDVMLTFQDESGIQIKKTYTFHRDSYVIDMSVQVINGSQRDWSGRLYRQLQRTQISESQAFIYTYTGGVVSSPKNVYEKVEFDDMNGWKPEESFSQGGWAAMIQHYFLGAWIPNQEEYNNFYSNVVDGSRYIIGLQNADTKIAAGQVGQFSSQIYIGPKEPARLREAAPNLELTVDYGVLTILSEPLYWLLDKIHSFVGNWGFAIIMVTLIIKLVFFKLSEAAYRSMANLRKFQPKIQALKERYGNDKQKMSQAMMDIYKKEKINPLGGCLPMLVQIPVFIALYWVLLESVELRQADFILWIDDLSSKDPFYVLPVIMGVSMWVQQKLNPAPMDPIQQKVLMALPWIFTLFFAFFPSGLVLYWVVNNILSIAQQWYITRKIEAQPAKS